MSNLKRFVLRLAGFFSLQAAVAGVVLTPYMINYRDVVANGFMAASIDKQAELKQPQSRPRLVLVGGSSVAYGYSSPLLKDHLQYEPVNMGLHAGLGAEFMLREVEPGLKSGDIVVISLEYENFIGFPPGAKDVYDVIEADWRNVQFLPLSYLPSLMDEGLVFLGGVFRRSVASATGDLERKPYYQRNSFNNYGDVTGHYGLPQVTEKIASEGKTFNFDPQDVQYVIRSLNEFNQRAKARNIRVFYSYAPLMKKVLTENQTQIENVAQTLSKSLEFPILDRPEDVAYLDSAYFDSRYHLNQDAARQRTIALIDRLSPHLPIAHHENSPDRP
ncbi:MAG: hypothetical protein KME43_05795 [Myxacorys chilensis ATA2-1-KO14]|jgi:hypothetical protein|nr:hypothetical protein [Myxacorys chilensis ATA2-1-KO14]